MGKITSFAKSNLSSMTSQLKSYDVGSQLKKAADSAGISTPDFSGITSNLKLDKSITDFKMPAGATNYISPVMSKALSQVKLPSEVYGVPIPQLPDLSSAISGIESLFSGIGINFEGLGLRSISDILKTPDLASVAKVPTTSIKLGDLPDVSKAFDSFDMSGLQSEIDSVTKDIPGMSDIDISKYF